MSISTPKQKGNLYLASSLCDGLEDNDLKQVTTLLRNKEADPNVFMPLHGVTPFHLVIGNDSEAFAEEVTKLFLRHGGNPNVKSVDGMTPVHVAAAWGRAKILDLLLANGGDPLCLDGDCCSPFHYAFQAEHYEAIAVLSKYCINSDEEDEKPKFKIELDKVLVNNGDVLAEYLVSDDQSLDGSNRHSVLSSSSKRTSKINASGYVPESASSDTTSPSYDFITVRKKQRKKVNEEKTNYTDNNDGTDNFDFKRETEEEEMHLINQIISRLSSSMTSDADINTTFQNYENECLVNCKSSSPKRQQITMVFNRPKKSNENSKVLENHANRRRSTLYIIQQHNSIPYFEGDKIVPNNIKKSCNSLDKNIFSKKNTECSMRNVTPIKSRSKNRLQENSLYANEWFDETIISKSPNLVINASSSGKKKKLLKNQNFEKKSSPTHSKISKRPLVITPNKTRSSSPNKLKNKHTYVSRIPRPKKFFPTPTNLRTVKRCIETPPKTVIPNKRKVDSAKRTSNSEKRKNVTPLNNTYNRSASSSSSLSTNTREFKNNTNKQDSYRNIAVNLNDRMYDCDNDINVFKETEECKQWKKSVDRDFANFEERYIKPVLGPDFLSGVGVLYPGILDKSSFTPSLNTDKEKEQRFTQEAEIDLNRAILDSVLNKKGEKKPDIDNENSKHFDKSADAFNSLLCEKDSLSSDSSNSFLSSDKVDCQVDSSCSSRKLHSETFLSIDEEYKYEDPEEGVAFLERRLCVSPSCASSDTDTSFYSCNTAQSEPLPKELFLLDNITLRERLKILGDNPGPITNTTHRLYLKRLHKLESRSAKSVNQNAALKDQPVNSIIAGIEKEKLKSSLLSIDWIQHIDDFEALEQKIFSEFHSPSPSRKWREGTSKSSFNYLLLDPRITMDLPRRAGALSMSEKWETFLSAIFYVGKGKRSRPYAHLYDAFKIWISHDQQNVNSRKIQRILDIWNEGKGVVVLHVFHNTIPVEAYTREAAMIEVLGTQKLGNCKCGDFYGVVSTWRSKEKCELGRYFLFKALQIFLLEGERQIFPDNL